MFFRAERCRASPFPIYVGQQISDGQQEEIVYMYSEKVYMSLLRLYTDMQEWLTDRSC